MENLRDVSGHTGRAFSGFSSLWLYSLFVLVLIIPAFKNKLSHETEETRFSEMQVPSSSEAVRN